MMRATPLCALALFGLSVVPAMAQLTNPISSRVINYKTVFDDPYDINQVWLSFAPFAANVSAGNMVVGYNLSARVFAMPKLQINGSLSGSYGKGTDYMRNTATNNAHIVWRQGSERRDQSTPFLTKFVPFSAIELGGTYHILDKESRSSSKIVLNSKKARVMEFTGVDYITVNSKNRHVWAARAGGMSFMSTVGLNKAIAKQNLDLCSQDGLTLTSRGQTMGADGVGSKNSFNQLYTNLTYMGGYVGGSYMLIRNVSVKADKFGALANNICLNVYADILVAPKPMLTDLTLARSPGHFSQFDLRAVKVSKGGFRTGFDVFYNQDLFYSFGAEAGLRPALKGQSFYVAGKFSFPTIAFKARRNRLANQAIGIQQ